MLQVKRNRSGFTLIELLFVVVIVGVLAAVATPLFGGQVQKARLSEAIAGLGTIRTAMRAEQAEAGVYPTIALGTNVVTANIGVVANDLLGRYFDSSDYSFTVASDGTTWCIGVVGGTAPNTAPQAAVVTTTPPTQRSIRQDGNLFKSSDCTGTAINASS